VSVLILRPWETLPIEADAADPDVLATTPDAPGMIAENAHATAVPDLASSADTIRVCPSAPTARLPESNSVAPPEA
jgi:hypothetical protein